MNARKYAVVVVASVAASTMLIAATPPGEQGGAPPQSSKAVVMKGRAPVSTEMLQIKLPRPVEADLPNGLHLMVLEDRRAPQVSFQIIIPGAGGYFDNAETPGVSVMTNSFGVSRNFIPALLHQILEVFDRWKLGKVF